MSSNVLVVDQLTKIFNAKKRLLFLKSHLEPFAAVKGISFALKEGEILGILGANGAGKTTLIEMLLGALTPTSGSIVYFGKELADSRSEILCKVTHASAYHKLPSALTIQENLEIIGGLYSMPKALLSHRIDVLLKQFDMAGFRHKRTGALSAGQMTRILLIKAFLPEPKIILLDEPTASLDPDIAKECREYLLMQQQEHRVSIILTSHNMKEVAQVCDRALVMKEGSIIQEDTPEMLAQSVSLTKVSLQLTNEVEKLVSYISGKYHFTLTDNLANIEMDETVIPSFLKQLHEMGIEYSRIDIDKPSLEDFFLQISTTRSL